MSSIIALATDPRKRGWLWSRTTLEATYYLMRRSRAAAIAQQMLGVALGTTLDPGQGVRLPGKSILFTQPPHPSSFILKPH